MVATIWRDLRYAARGLRGAPGFTSAVVLTLAIGIGANTAIFSAVDQLLLRPLPYPEGDALVMIYEAGMGHARAHVSPANWMDWQRRTRAFESLAAWNTTVSTLTGSGEPERLDGQLVSLEFFPVLGVQPLLGRVVSAGDDRPNATPIAVLSYSLWQREFGGDPSVVGRVIQLNETPTEVIGVMPRGFSFVFVDTDYWAAYRLDRDRPWRQNAGRFMRVVGRLRPDVGVPAARSEMESIARRLAEAHPAFNKDMSVTLVPLREELTGQVRDSLLVLYAAVGVLLAIACFNVANLLLARSSSRQREFALRTAIGAGHGAIVRQLLVESITLAAAGGLLGIVVARWSVDALLALAPADLLGVSELHVDGRFLLYVFGLSLVTGIAIGLVPAVSAARRSPVESLRTRGSSGARPPRVRQLLVVAQVGMTVILLCGAGLLIRTNIALTTTGTGLDPGDVLTLQVALPVSRYEPDRRVAFLLQVRDALQRLPGVESIAAANSLPVIGSPRAATVFHVHGQPELPVNERPVTYVRVVTPAYFRTLRIPILHGRDFTAADRQGAAPQAFIVNEAFATRYLSGTDPLTASISVLMARDNPYGRIIGVVGSVSEGSLRDGARPTVFYAHGQQPEATMALFVRAKHPEGLGRAATRAIGDLDANLAVTNIRTLETALGESLGRERLNAVMSGLFALSGLILASLGLYGLLVLLVVERTKEIGVRMALGARPGRLLGNFLGEGLLLVTSGAAVGVCGALMLSRSLDALLFGVASYDPIKYVVVLALLGIVATSASFVPARRAMRVDPLNALRQE